MQRIMIWLALLFWATCSNAGADTTVKIFDLDQSVSPSTREWKINVPPFGVEHQVRLSFDVRINAKALSGSNPWMRVAVNGNYLTKPDLLNKLDEFRLRSGLDLTWSRGDRWRVLYSPDFEAAIKRTDDPNGVDNSTEPYRYVWDITRFVKPGENVLQVYNPDWIAKPTTLVLRNGIIEVGKPQSPPAGAGVEPAPTGPLSTFIDGGKQKIPLNARQANGALQLTVAGETFNITTRTSLPNSQWQEASTNWGAPLGGGQSQTLNWKTPSYEVRRTVTLRDDHAHIADTLTNTTPNLIGVIVEHRAAFPRKPERVLTAGREIMTSSTKSNNAYQPSVFAQWKNVGLGLIAEDDVFRSHIKSFSDPGSIGLADEQLGLEPGKPVTLEWNIYPVLPEAGNNGDYWDFVNAVRRNWGSNYTIPGPFVFPGFRQATPPESYPDWVRKRDVKIVAGGIPSYPDGKYAHGTGIMFAPKWVAEQAAWVAKLHEQTPNVKALHYFHAQCTTEPDGETKYAADRLRDDEGKPLNYPYRYPLPLYLPTRDSPYGKAVWGAIRTILDDIKADGLYWDEMSHSVIQSTSNAPWDGYTVAIDPETHDVKGKRCIIPLMTQPLRQDIVRYLRQHNKLLVANTQPMTRTMLREKVIRFVETGTYDHLYNTHFGCPLGLGNHHNEETRADSATNVRNILKRGAVYYGHTYRGEPAPWNFTSMMFPITPSRLGPGFVIGEERIHTTVSGRFGFPDGAAADVFVVDAQGARVADPQVKEVLENGRRIYEIRIPTDHFAVLVKK